VIWIRSELIAWYFYFYNREHRIGVGTVRLVKQCRFDCNSLHCDSPFASIEVS